MQRISSRAASVALIAVAAVFVGWLSLVLTGHRSLVVMSGSMEPVISAGDLAIVRAIAPSDAEVGDVVTFRDPTRGRQLVTHRAVYIRDMGSVYAFATRGDQNSSIEEWTVDEDGSIGRLTGAIPLAGYPLNWFASPLVRAALIAGACVLLAVVAMRTAVQLGKPATQSSAALCIALLIGIVVGGRAFPGTLAAFSSVNVNAANTFQAATSFCTPGSVVLSASADAWVDEESTTTNNGAGPDLFVKSGVPKNKRAFIHFSLPALQYCSLQSATLQLYSPTASAGPRTIDVYRAAAAWTETGVTWENQPATAGTAVGAPSGSGWRSWNVTAHVQAMYAGPNDGFIVRDMSESSGPDEQAYASRETALGPVLVVNYA